jgi:general secretion pathway protein C
LSQLVQQFKPFFISLQSNKKMIAFLSFLLILLFAWLLGRFTTSLLEELGEPKWQDLDATVSAGVAQGKVSYLFGKPDKAVTKVEKKPSINIDEVKKTRLNLTLVGIIMLGENALALIESAGKTLVVFVGDEIMPQVVLQEVFAEEIVISNGGVQELLSLVRGKNQLLTKKNNRQQSAVIAEQNSLSEDQSDSLNKIGSILRKSPMSISKFIKFKPINKNGRWTGVQIWSRTDKKLFKALGFEEGDMLVNVNGTSINELAITPNLWRAFLSESQFDLIVERNGQQHGVSVDLSGS